MRVSKKSTKGSRKKGRVTAREVENEEYVTQTVEQIKSLRYQAYVDQKPWLDAEGNMIWSQWRMKAGEIIFSQAFETCMGCIICLNIGIIMFETNQDAQCFPAYAENVKDCPYRSTSQLWSNVLNMILNVVYTLECAARLYVERSSFFCNRWNLIDLLTLVAGWLASSGINIGNVAVLRMFRLVRVVRAVRVLVSIPEFYLLITGLYSSIKAILFGAMMLVSVILFWAVISVEVLHPYTSRLQFDQCERCPKGFANIFSASVTLFQQIVAGDAWGAISIPLVEDQPWTAVILFSILITISLGVLNLILAVIVERAAEARENDQEAKLKKKQQDRAKSMEELALLCANMDLNHNGMVSFEELLQGYDELPEFKRLMEVMDIKREDMETVFHVLDSDDSSEVSYLEFCQNLGSFFRRDPVIMQSLVKYSVLEVRKILERDVLEILNEHTNMLRILLRRNGDISKAPDTDPPKTSESVLATCRNIEAEMGPLLARAEDLAMTAMLAVNEREKHEKPRRFSHRTRVCQRQISPGAMSPTFSGHPSTNDSCGEFSIQITGSESPVVTEDTARARQIIQSPNRLSQVSAEIIEMELDDLESTSDGVPDSELDRRFFDLCSKFKERMHDAERFQERCQRTLQLIESHMEVHKTPASLARMKLHKL